MASSAKRLMEGLSQGPTVYRYKPVGPKTLNATRKVVLPDADSLKEGHTTINFSVESAEQELVK
jgi:hypothetical protein